MTPYKLAKWLKQTMCPDKETGFYCISVHFLYSILQTIYTYHKLQCMILNLGLVCKNATKRFLSDV
jgi:hypothetical protein